MASSARRRLWRVAAVAGGGGELGPWPRRPWLGAGRRGEQDGVARGEFGSRPRRPWRQRRGSGAHGAWRAPATRGATAQGTRAHGRARGLGAAAAAQAAAVAQASGARA